MDYAVDGRPLHGFLLHSDRGSSADDLIPVLVCDWPPDDDIDSLLGERGSYLEDGRVPRPPWPSWPDPHEQPS